MRRLTFPDRPALVAWIAEQLAEDDTLRALVAETIAAALGTTFPCDLDPCELDDTVRHGLRYVLAEWEAFRHEA